MHVCWRKTLSHVSYKFYKCHTNFHLGMWWHSKVLKLSSSIVVLIRAHSCFHGTRPTQSMVIQTRLSLFRNCARSISGQMWNPANQKHAMWLIHHKYFLGRPGRHNYVRNIWWVIVIKIALCKIYNHKTIHTASI